VFEAEKRIPGRKRGGQKGNKNAGAKKTNCPTSDNSFPQNSANPPSSTDRKKIAAKQAGIGHDTCRRGRCGGIPTAGNFFRKKKCALT